MSIRTFALGCSGLIGTMLLSAQALAQSPEETSQQSVGLAEIVVTAQKRAQDLQEVPAAVTALTASALEDRGISDTTDLMGALPNLQVTSAYGRTQPNFTLRGISVANEFSASTASPIGIYVDEVYQSFRSSHGQQLFDLDRVEVVRGPQGTLYGRNTTGGAINFITRRPSLDGASGQVTLGYRNFDTFTADAAGEVTLAPGVFGVRLAGTYGEGGGYTFNPTLNEDFATTSFFAARLTALYRPTSNLEIIGKVFTGEDDPLQDIPYGIGYLEGRRDAGGYSRFDPRPELGGRVLEEDEIQADTAGTYFSSATGGSLTVNWELSDALTLTSITGYDVGEFRLSPFDCDGSPNNVCAIRYNSESENINQDVRLTWETDRFTAIAGVYYGRDEIETINEPDFFGFLAPLLTSLGLPQDFFNPAVAVEPNISTLPAFAIDPTLTPSDPGFCDAVVVNPAGFFDARSLIAFNADVFATNAPGFGPAQLACLAAGAPPFANILARQEFTLSRPSTAVYGELAYDLTDKLTVTMGLRYTRDVVRFSDGLTTVTDLGGTVRASTVPFSFPFDPNIARVNQEETTGEVTGRIIFDYQFTDSILGYAGYSRGYRSGTYNGLAYQSESQVFFVEPETVNAFEGGLKTRFLNDRAQLNLALFYYDYKNQQIAEIVGATAFLRNASGRVFGLETEALLQVNDRLQLDAALGYLNTRYDEDQRFTPGGLDIGGNEFPNAPTLSFTGGADFTLWRDGGNELYLRGDAQYQGEYFFDPFGDYGQDPCDQPAPGRNVLLATPELACGNPSYWLLNARMTYQTPRYAVSVWGRNLTDEFYFTYGLNLNAFFQDYLVRGAPRTYGVEITARF